nr:MAG TPA: hypothetical protein [Caudoviricetes sp.]
MQFHRLQSTNLRRVKTVERKREMLSTKRTKTPDHYPCGHMRGPGWHDWRACLTKQGIEEDEWPV